MQRALKAQQAAYEAARVVVDRARARRDAEWQIAAGANRRRAFTVLLAPFALGVVVGALGAVTVLLAAVGGALLIVWAVVAAVSWHEAGGRVKQAAGGADIPTAVAAGTVQEKHGARLADVTEGLCASLGLPLPEMRIVADPGPNALSLGRDPSGALLLATSALVETLERIELEGAVAHELCHVKRLDILTGSLLATPAVRILDALSGGRASGYLLGDSRELEADLAAVSLTRYPPGLLAALEKIRHSNEYARPAASGSAFPSGAAGPLAGAVAGPTSRIWLAPLRTDDGAEALAERIDVLQEL